MLGKRKCRPAKCRKKYGKRKKCHPKCHSTCVLNKASHVEQHTKSSECSAADDRAPSTQLQHHRSEGCNLARPSAAGMPVLMKAHQITYRTAAISPSPVLHLPPPNLLRPPSIAQAHPLPPPPISPLRLAHPQ